MRQIQKLQHAFWFSFKQFISEQLFGDIQSIRNDTSDMENESIPPQSKPLRPSIKTQPAYILESRMRPFLCRPIACRSVDVEVFQKTENLCFSTT